MEEKKYYADYKKFTRIYLVVLVFFYIFFAITGNMSPADHWIYTLISSVIIIIFLHYRFKTWIVKVWVVTLGENELETFGMDGSKRIVAYDNIERAIIYDLVFIKLYFFHHKDDAKKIAVITNYVENYEECIEKIEKRLIDESQ